MPTPDEKRRPGEGGERDDQHDGPSHTGGGLSKGVWFMLEPARLAVHLFGKSEVEIGKWTLSLATALAKGQRKLNSFADELMDERERFIEVRRTCGGMRGKGDSSPKVTLDNGRHNPTRPYPTLPDPTSNDERESKAVGAALSQIENEIPSFESFKSFGAERGFDPETVRGCFDYYTASGWIDSKGKPVKSWRGKLASWVANQKSPRSPSPTDHRAERARKEYPPNATPSIS